MSKFELLDKRVPMAEDNVALYHDLTKCKNCSLCRRACADTMSVLDYYDLESTGDVPICIHCGQCASVCPFGALYEKSELDKVKEAIAAPDKIVVVQTAPAVRVGIGEEFGYEPGTYAEGQMIGAIRALGADYVVDTNFGADLTIMEEGNELLARLEGHHGPLPQFTSCCPAWVQFCETFFPEMIPHISSTRSCIAMESAAIKTYFAKEKGIDPKQIVSVSINPCTAKKFEINRPEQNKSAEYWDIEGLRDTDYSLTTREFAEWIRSAGFDFSTVEESAFDDLIGASSGAGVIFGNTGGVMEAAIRTVYYTVTGETPEGRLVHLEEVRGMAGVKEAEVQIGDRTVRVAVCHGGKNVRDFVEKVKSGDVQYDFIEMMACPGGCIGGGGQPRTKLPAAVKTKEARIASLYKRDADLTLRSSYENPEVQAMYENFLGEPLGELSEALLHTKFEDRSAILGERKDVVPETCPTSPKFKPE